MLLSASSRPVHGVGLDFGPIIIYTGALGLAVALAFSVRHPGSVSDAVLLLAAVGVLLGEGLGPGALRRALIRKDEIRPEAAAEPAPPPNLESRA